MKIENPRDANGPNGYPIPGTNKAFDEAAKRTVQRRKKDAEQAERFLEKLGKELSGHNDKE